MQAGFRGRLNSESAISVGLDGKRTSVTLRLELGPLPRALSQSDAAVEVPHPGGALRVVRLPAAGLWW